MKKSMIIFAAIILMAGLTSTLMAQSTATTNASAKILTALTITNTVPLNFGTMTVPTAATTVTVDPYGTRTSAGNITLLAQAPIFTSAAYSVTGDAGATYTITLPGSIYITGTTWPWTAMPVNGFTTSKTGNASTLGTGGTDSFTLGATLNLASGQAAGTYTGTFDVSVAYN